MAGKGRRGRAWRACERLRDSLVRACLLSFSYYATVKRHPKMATGFKARRRAVVYLCAGSFDLLQGGLEKTSKKT